VTLCGIDPVRTGIVVTSTLGAGAARATGTIDTNATNTHGLIARLP
jgi:hypothetical protein